MNTIYRAKLAFLAIITSLFTLSAVAQTVLTLPANMPARTFSSNESVTYKFDQIPGTFTYSFKKGGASYNKLCKSTLLIERSDNGSQWSRINSYSNSFDQSVTVPLPKSTRFVKISFEKCWSNGSTAILQASSMISKSLDVRDSDDSPVAPSWVIPTTSILSTVTKQIKVKYDNLADKIALSLSDATHFSVSTTEIGVAGGKGESLVTIAYNPQAVGSHTAMLTIRDTGSGADSQTIHLLGSASPERATLKEATNIKDFSFIANWSPAVGATSYKLVVKREDTVIFSENVGNSTSKTISGLNFNTLYNYEVISQATGAADAPVSLSQSVRTTSPTVTPLAATAMTYTSFVANWNALENVAGYRISVVDAAHQSIATVDQIVNLHTAEIGGLLPDRTYYYTVAAYNQSGVYTAESTSIEVRTSSMIPQGIQDAVDISYFEFKAGWQPLQGVTGYRVNVYEGSNRVVSQEFEAHQTFGTVVGLMLGRVYIYSVQALLGEVVSDESVASSPFTTRSAHLTGVTASIAGADGSSMVISWSPLPATIADRYEVQVVNKYSGSTVLSFTQGATNNNLYTLTALSKGVTYSYQVRAIVKAEVYESSAIQELRAPVSLPLTITDATQGESEWFHLKSDAKIESGAYNLGNIEFEVSEAPRSVDIEFDATDNLFTIVPKLEVYEWDIKTSAWRMLYSGTWEQGTGHKLSVNFSPTTRYISIKKVTYGAAINGNILLRNITVTKAETAVDPPVVQPATAITANGFTANWTPVEGATDYKVALYEDYNGVETPLDNYSLTVGNVSSKAIILPQSYTFRGSYKVQALVDQAWTNQSDAQRVQTLVALPLLIADHYNSHGIVYRNTTSYDQGVVFAETTEGQENELEFRFDATPGVLEFAKGVGRVDIYTATEQGVFTTTPEVAASELLDYTLLLDADVRYIRIVANHNKLTNIRVSSDFYLISAPELTFAPLEVGATCEEYIRLNALNMPGSLTVSSTNELQFSHPTQIETGQDIVIPITYNPNTPGQHTSRLTVTYQDKSLIVDLIGSSQLAAPMIEPISQITRTEATVSWSSVVGADSYIIDVKRGQELVAGYTNKDVGNRTTTLISGLEPGGTYQVTIQAQQGGFKSPLSPSQEFTTQSPALAIPTLPPPLITKDGFTLRWSQIAAADQYILSIDGVETIVPADRSDYYIAETLTESKSYLCSVIASLSSDPSRNSPASFQRVVRTYTSDLEPSPVVDIDIDPSQAPDVILDEHANIELVAADPTLKVTNIVFTSTADHTSSLGIAPGKSIEVVGAVRLKKQFVTPGDWEFVSFPFDVSADQISGLITVAASLPMGDDTKPGAYYVRKYATTVRAQQGAVEQVWEYIKAPTNQSTIIFEKNKGYIVSLDKNFALHLPQDQQTLVFGSAKHEAALFTSTNGDHIGLDASRKPTGDDRNIDGGWNLIGNPYAHSYQITDLPTRAVGELSEFIYYYEQGDYKVWSTDSDIEEDNRPMRPFSAYFVKSNGAQQVDLAPTISKSVRALHEYDQLMVSMSQPNHHSRTVIRLREESTPLFDASLDAPYMRPFASSNMEFYSHYDHQYSYNSLPFNQDQAAVKLGYKTTNMDGDITISLSENSRLIETKKCLLIDHLTGKQVDLALEDYTFTPASADRCDDRFTLQLSRVSTGDKPLMSGILLFSQEGQIIADHLPVGARVSVVDMSGVIRYDHYTQSTHLEIPLPIGAVYMVRVVESDRVEVYRIRL